MYAILRQRCIFFEDNQDNYSFLRIHCRFCPSCLPISHDGVWAVVLAFAGFAVFADPDVVELLHGMLDDLRIIGQDARLEVTLIATLHADACPREVCAADIHILTVKDQHLEVNPGTQHSFQPVIKHGIPVKVLPEVRPRLLSMNQPHLNPSPNQQRNNGEKRLFLLTNLHIQVLDVSRPNPQRALHRLHPTKHLPIMVTIRNELNHASIIAWVKLKTYERN